jgi:hypothetical protein
MRFVQNSWWNFIQDSSYETMGASLIQGIMLLKKHVEIEKWKMKNEKWKKKEVCDPFR